MADDKNPTTDQEKLAKEVLAGERTITASEPKVAIPDDVAKQALLASYAGKETIDSANLPNQGAEADTNSHRRGPTTVPGQQAEYGRNYNPIKAPDINQTPQPTPEPTPSPTPPGE